MSEVAYIFWERDDNKEEVYIKAKTDDGDLIDYEWYSLNAGVQRLIPNLIENAYKALYDRLFASGFEVKARE